jgi:DNA gyrase subunit A
MVQRTGVKGISLQGRPAQGVRLMNLREDDTVSAVALVMESEAATAAPVDELPLPEGEAGPQPDDPEGESFEPEAPEPEPEDAAEPESPNGEV